jgi:hypothetical protein
MLNVAFFALLVTVITIISVQKHNFIYYLHQNFLFLVIIFLFKNIHIKMEYHFINNDIEL